MQKDNHIRELSFDLLLQEIEVSIIAATSRIYATHFLGTHDDMIFPEPYQNALRKSNCSVRQRIIFGNKNLYGEFLESESLGFSNSFNLESHYQRMLLVDNKIFFRSGRHFYVSSSSDQVSKFLEYFTSINTVSS